MREPRYTTSVLFPQDTHVLWSVLADDPVVVKPNQLKSAWPRCCSSLHELTAWGGSGACSHWMPWIDFWTSVAIRDGHSTPKDPNFGQFRGFPNLSIFARRFHDRLSYRLHDCSSPAIPAALMKPPRIRMNFPKFPVGFPHQRGVVERLTSIGDRVHYPCETMGTLEGFDEDGNWSKIHHNSYGSTSGWKNPCVKSAS